MPESVRCRGVVYRHLRTFKHDFFAATGLYQGPDGLAVLKLGRVSDFCGCSLSWLGRWLETRERRLYAQLQGLRGIPRLLGAVGPNGLLHEYVPGQPLARREDVPDDFFDRLEALVEALHRRHIAYVDLNKRQNILKGEDGQPYLIDFQIALHLPPVGWRRLPPVQWLLRRFQQADRYHCLKHKRRLRPDRLRPEEHLVVSRISPWIRLHRWLTRPLTYLRRRLLAYLARNEDFVVPGSSAK